MFFLSCSVHSGPATSVVVPWSMVFWLQVRPRCVPQTWNPHDCNHEPTFAVTKYLANLLPADSLPHRFSMIGWGALMDFLKKQTKILTRSWLTSSYIPMSQNFQTSIFQCLKSSNSQKNLNGIPWRFLRGSRSSAPVTAATAADPATCWGVGTTSRRSMGYWLFYTCLYILPGIFQDYKDFPSIYILLHYYINIVITTLWCRVWFVDEWWWMAMDIPGSRNSCSFMLCAVINSWWQPMDQSRWGPWTGGEHLVSPIGAGWDSEISDVITMAGRSHAAGK